MSISDISIKNHVFAWMLMLGLLVFGAIGFSRMGVSQLPAVDFPTVSISVSLTGASPEVIEMDVVDVIEGALTSIPGIVNMSSSSETGNGSITVEFDLNKDIDVAVAEVQSALGRVQKNLPADMDPPTVRKTNPDDQPILWVSVTAENMERKELMILVRDQIQDRFTTIDGVGEVTLSGFINPNLRVWLSQKKLNEHQLTASDILTAIKREHSEKPGGRIETPKIEYNIRTLGEAPSVVDFENIAITKRGGAINYSPIPLKSVAQVEDGTEDVRSISRSQGKISVGLGIKKQPGANAVKVASDIKERIKEIATQLPKGVQIGVRFDTTTFIKEAVDEMNFTLIFSAFLTAIICWLFLGSWSATLNVILAIPTSIVGSFIILSALGYTLNTFTLLGLALAIGIVVDDAIMVLENIVRHIELKKSRRVAAIEGTREITLAAVAATAAIIAIFLPVAFMKGVIGKYFMQFGVTLTVAVAISLLEALTLTPMRCSRFLSVKERTSFLGKLIEKGFIKSAELYKRAIPIVINHPIITISFASLFFIGTLYLGKVLKQEFIPPQDQSVLMIRLQAPVGTALEITNTKMKDLEAYLSKRDEVEGYFSSVGGQNVNNGFIFLTLKPADKRKLSAQKLADVFRKELKTIIPKTKIIIIDPSLGALGAKRSYPVQFTIRGSDFKKLIELSGEMMKGMEKSGLMTDIDTNFKEGLPEIQVIPDRVKALQYGVDVAEITDTVNIMMSGAIGGKYSQGGRRYDVRVGLPASGRNSADDIKNLFVRNNRNELIPLSSVIKLEEKSTLQSISREDRQRAITIRANVALGSSQGDAIKAVNQLAKEILPTGYYSVISGSAKTFQESFQSLIFALVLGILVSYMILASQFNSFIHPITILIALPFSLSGAFLALYFGGQTLNIYSMIGLILLMGIVKKNSILLVEFTNHMKATGLNTRQALIEACPIRLRPILMTSIATIVGALPPALAIGPGAESRIPMALAVIGGVFVSTFLTLFVVPCVYSLFDKIKFLND